MEIAGIVKYNQASTWQRLANLVIDFIVCYFFVAPFFIISRLIHLDIIEYFFGWTSSILIGILRWMLVRMLLYFLFMFAIEYFTRGRSIGKLVTGTEVVTKEGKKPTVGWFFIRNISRLAPFEPFSFIGSNTGWHDRWSNTCVVKLKDFEDDLQNQKDIEEIGKN